MSHLNPISTCYKYNNCNAAPITVIPVVISINQEVGTYLHNCVQLKPNSSNFIFYALAMHSLMHVTIVQAYV